MASIINCADNEVKTPERVARAKEMISPTKKLEDKEEKRREQNKKRSQKEEMKCSLKSLTALYEYIEDEALEDALDRLMT